MTEPKIPKLSKWPFFLADFVLVGAAAWIVYLRPYPIGEGSILIMAALTTMGAWLSIIPFLTQNRAAIKVAEAGALTTVVEQINELRTLTNQISFATAQWQVAQDHAADTVKAAHGIAERITKEAEAFGAFMQKHNDAEKAHLRLEVEKLRKGQSEWIDGTIRVMDHVYALHQAAVRSGQQPLIKQLTYFQNACREALRRVGLTPVEAEVGLPFDEKAHQFLDPKNKPASGALVKETVATGYRYQGQMLRLPLVDLNPPEVQPDGEPTDQQQIVFPSATDAPKAD